MRQLTPDQLAKAYAEVLHSNYRYCGISTQDQSNLPSMTAFLLDTGHPRESLQITIQAAANFWPETVNFTIVGAATLDPHDHPPLPQGATILAFPVIMGNFNLA